jgi:hypothetical protein
VSRQLFIYWRVEPDRLPQALAAVRQAQGGLMAAWPGLTARVLERCDPAQQATVMEIYAAPGGIDADGEQRIADALAGALAGIALGSRHVEAFAER